LVDGQATFVDPKTIKVADRQLTAGKILITTGSRTAVPNIPGISEIDWIDHISALELTELPKSMIVLGGGPVGLELAQAFARFGSRVTIVNSGPHMAARSDQEAAEELQKALAEDGIELVHNSRPKAVEKSNDGISVTLDPSGQKISAEKLMLASGRTINVEELNLPAAGVEYSPRSIKVDEQMRTTADGIWAAGDVTGIQFTPVAQYQARIAVDDMFGKPRAADYRFLPTAIFTDPEIAGVGLTEEAARQAGLDFATAVHPLRNVTRAKYYKAEHGLFKVVYNKSSRAVLGIHIVSRNASDIVQGFALAMQKGITVDDLVNMHHIYPSYGEGIKAAADRALP
jgi:mercuric reductase